MKLKPFFTAMILFIFLISASVITISGNGFSRELKTSDSLKTKIVDIILDTALYQPLLKKGESVWMRSGRIILKKGENVGEHSTDNYEEFVIVLVGSGYALNEKGEKIRLNEGQALYIPPYKKHNIYNDGSEILMYIYVVSRAYEDTEHEH